MKIIEWLKTQTQDEKIAYAIIAIVMIIFIGILANSYLASM